MSKTYGTRGVANPHNHEVYKMFTSKLGLNPMDEKELEKRGLSPAQIRAAGYATKGNNKDKVTYKAMADTGAALNLDDVPGFHVDPKTGHRTMAYVSGLVIPIYDFNGHIKGLLIRNDRAKQDAETGKLLNKYVGYSSAGKLKGGRTYNGTHCPMVKGMPKESAGLTIYVTEGVLKADIVTALSELYCLGLQGLNMHEDFIPTIEQLEVSTIKLAFDAGEDQNVDIIRGKAKLIKAMKEIGIDVLVCKWDASLGKGLDDVIKAGHEDKIEFMSEEEIEEIMKAAKVLDPFTGEWIYVLEEERVYNTKDFKSWKKQQFADMYGMIKGEEVSKMIAERKLDYVERVTYWPGQPLMVEDGGYKCLNIWKPSGILPMAGDVAPFIEFIEYLFPDEFERKCVLQWVGYMLRNPGKKILFALMLVGGQGVGKSLFVKLIKTFIGMHNCSTPTTENLLEQFNGFVQHKSLCCVEEVKAHGRYDIYNKLKTWITEETIMCRVMNKIAYEIANRTNWILLTNFLDALPIDIEDRRTLFAGVPDLKMPDEFYEKLIAWMAEPVNLQAILQYFHDVDLTGFNAKGRAPMTNTKQKAINSNLTQLEEYVITRIEDNAYPFHAEVISIRHLRDKRVCPPGLERQSDVRWADALKKAGAIPINKQVILSDKSKVKLWAYGPQKVTIAQNCSSDMLRDKYEKSVLDVEPGNPLAEQSKF